MESTIYFAGGCFWGLQKFFDQFPSVTTEVGYANGSFENPSYEQVCRMDTGHAETVKVIYDPSMVSLPQLIFAFLHVIDPFTLNRQGNDVGTQYRTGIYYQNQKEKQIINLVLDYAQKAWKRKTAIEVLPLENFSPAETYHQKYLDKNPRGYCHISPAMMHDFKLASKEQIEGEIPALKPLLEP